MWERVVFTTNHSSRVGTHLAEQLGASYNCTDVTKNCSVADAAAPLGSPLVFILQGGAHYELLKDIGNDDGAAAGAGGRRH